MDAVIPIPSVLTAMVWLLPATGVCWAERLAHTHPVARALIQERGTTLASGRASGGMQAPLERASGGDTPVLTFNSDQGPVRLLLDTGAASAMVSPSLVRRLALKSQTLSPEQFSLAGGGETCAQGALSKTQLPELRSSAAGDLLQPMRLEGVEAFVLPMVALPPGVDGVLGASTLKQVPFGIDPLSEQVFFGAPALQWRQRWPNRPEVIPLRWRRGVLLGELRVGSGSSDRISRWTALVDTGAEGLFLTPALAARLRPLGPVQPARLIGVCGEQKVRRQRLMGLGLGPQARPNQILEGIVMTNPVFSLLGVEAIAGQEVLRFRRQFWRLETTPPRLELW